MSLLQRNISATASSVAEPATPEEKRFIIIHSRDLTSTELDALNIHGKVVVYSDTTFQGITSLSQVSFNYLLFDINNSSDKNWISTNISAINEYVIVITSDDQSEDEWLQTLSDGGYLTTILKAIPTGNLIKSVFDEKLLNTVYLPHRKSCLERLVKKITPSCLSGVVSDVSVVVAKIGILH